MSYCWIQSLVYDDMADCFARVGHHMLLKQHNCCNSIAGNAKIPFSLRKIYRRCYLNHLADNCIPGEFSVWIELMPVLYGYHSCFHIHICAVWCFSVILNEVVNHYLLTKSIKWLNFCMHIGNSLNRHIHKHANVNSSWPWSTYMHRKFLCSLSSYMRCWFHYSFCGRGRSLSLWCEQNRFNTYIIGFKANQVYTPVFLLPKPLTMKK